MPKTASQIMADIAGFIQKHGGSADVWFVGASEDPHAALEGHGFRKGDKGLIRTAGSEMQANEVVDYFKRQVGTKGTNGQVSMGEVHVYAFRRGPHTKP